MNLIFSHFDALSDGIKRIFQQPIYGFLNIIVFSLAITIPLIFYVFVANLTIYTNGVKVAPQLTVFLEPNIVKSKLTLVEEELQSLPQIREISFVSKHEALEKLRLRDNVNSLLSELESNPLPDAFVLDLTDNDPAMFEHVRSTASQISGVDQVQADGEWVSKLNIIITLGRLIILLLSSLLAISVVVVNFNTTRLQVLTRQREIELSKLIGATNTYIKRPFLYFGAIQGLLSSIGAIFLAKIFVMILNNGLFKLGELYETTLTLSALKLNEIGMIIGLAVALGWTAAWLSTTKYLNTLEYN